MSETKRSPLGLIISLVFLVLVIGLGYFAWTQKQFIIDQISVWTFEPSSSVSAIDEKLALSDKGTFYFYTTHPEVNTAEQFNANCPQQEKNSPILGCYSKQRIFIYDVQDARLDGIKEVTAAHEMLHAAWERTTPNEKARLSKLLENAASSVSNQAFQDRMAYYSRTEPGELDNELHSIIGTEVTTLDPELEDYYAQFFTDRAKVVGYYNKYNQIFVDLTNQSEALYQELTRLGDTISSDSNQYDSDIETLSDDIDSFNNRAQNDGFSSAAQFNRERAALMARSAALDAKRASINENVGIYNQKYNEYQTIAAQIQNLNSSVNSMADVSDTPSLN